MSTILTLEDSKTTILDGTTQDESVETVKKGRIL
jgi:hypothetical protein